MGRLTERQRTALLSPITPERVQELKGMAHLEAWDVRRFLIKIFGLCGWDFKVQETELVYQHAEEKKRRNGDGTYLAHTVVYRVTGRLIVKDEAGYVLAVYDDGAAGDAINQPSVGDAHDMALKTAMSQAIKRCAVNLGDQFGLSLYDDGSMRPTVVQTLVPDDGDYVREPVAEETPAPKAAEFHPRAEAQELMASVNAMAHQGAAGRVWARIVDAFKKGVINEAEANWLRARFEERGPELPPDPDTADETPAALEGELIETGATE